MRATSSSKAADTMSCSRIQRRSTNSCSTSCPRRRRSGLAERGAPLDVGGVDHVAVALDVAVLAADDEEDGRLVTGVRHLARRRRLNVQETTRPELAHFA